MALTKALIIKKATQKNARDESIPVMFNPPEYQLQRTNQFVEIGIPGLGSSLLQFVRGSAQTLTMELFFDTTNTGDDVSGSIDKVVSLTNLDPETHAPPQLAFAWGKFYFPCVLESVQQRFTRFNPAGQPVRAELSVTLKGFDLLEDLLAGTPLESADHTQQRIVREGDTLQSIAAEAYDDPRQWRAIAQANHLADPLTLTVGQRLIIPSIT
jgi:nucleoid-associated protein YgaU